MADGDPSNNGGTNNNGGAGGEQKPTGDANIDLTTISGDQLAKVLENKELWNLPRMKELTTSNAELKKLKDAQATKVEEDLKEQKKFEELATAKENENKTLKEQLQTNTIDRALTNKLVPEGVVDLEAALKLVDRGDIKIDDNGNITGVEEALTSLKEAKAYLFGEVKNPSLGGPTNGNGKKPPTGVQKFKRSQLTDNTFYKENRDAILLAQANGMIEED